jgi:hypothetical protein
MYLNEKKNIEVFMQLKLEKYRQYINLSATDFFLILAHPVFKM